MNKNKYIYWPNLRTGQKFKFIEGPYSHIIFVKLDEHFEIISPLNQKRALIICQFLPIKIIRTNIFTRIYNKLRRK